MGSLKKRRKTKINKHKRKKRMRANRHKKRLRYRSSAVVCLPWSVRIRCVEFLRRRLEVGRDMAGNVIRQFRRSRSASACHIDLNRVGSRIASPTQLRVATS